MGIPIVSQLSVDCCIDILASVNTDWSGSMAIYIRIVGMIFFWIVARVKWDSMEVLCCVMSTSG